MSIQSEISRIAGEVSTQNDLLTQIEAALEGKAVSGGSGEASIGTVTATPSSNSRSISFTGLSGEPKMFCVVPQANITLTSTSRYALNVVYDGSTTRGICSNTSTATHSTDGFPWTYSNGTLTINTTSTSNGGYFRSGIAYQLTYVT